MIIIKLSFIYADLVFVALMALSFELAVLQVCAALLEVFMTALDFNCIDYLIDILDCTHHTDSCLKHHRIMSFFNLGIPFDNFACRNLLVPISSCY